jgi:class 3 adenylate cyclase
LTREHLVRRLTAIFAADVAGYSRLTGMDEEGTHVRLKEHLRVLIDPKVAAYRGHIVKNTGDGFLAEFNSVVDAMRCAVDVQRGMVERNLGVPPSNRVEFRIGINVGDIIEDDGEGRPVDIKQVGRELGVRYVLEGSVRKAGNRIRIAGQLIDAETGAHLWADRFDGALEDMFDLQDQVTSSVVGAIAPKLQYEEMKRARRKPTESLVAYDYYLRGLASARPWTKDANSEALQLFCKAIEIDPGLACAYGMAAWCYIQRKTRGWMIEHVQESAEATRLARKAVHLGGDDPVALCMGGYALAFVAHEFDDALAFMDRGLAVNPNSAQACHTIAVSM